MSAIQTPSAIATFCHVCYMTHIARAFPLHDSHCRHSRFGGTFTIANMKSISEREVIYHHSVNSAKSMTFDTNKRRTKRAKNRKAITAEELKRKSTLSIRLFLKEFCVQFLVNCYNPLMHSVKVGHEDVVTLTHWPPRDLNKILDK